MAAKKASPAKKVVAKKAASPKKPAVKKTAPAKKASPKKASPKKTAPKKETVKKVAAPKKAEAPAPAASPAKTTAKKTATKKVRFSLRFVKRFKSTIKFQFGSRQRRRPPLRRPRSKKYLKRPDIIVSLVFSTPPLAGAGALRGCSTQTSAENPLSKPQPFSHENKCRLNFCLNLCCLPHDLSLVELSLRRKS